MNYFPILLKDKLKKPYYDHFLLLVYATKCLTSTNISDRDIDHAEFLLDSFVDDIEKLYGRNKLSFNTHRLTHMSNFCRFWGPLQDWSAFFLRT